MDSSEIRSAKNQKHVNGHVIGPFITKELRTATHDFVDQFDAVKRAVIEALREGVNARSRFVVQRMEERPLQTILTIFGAGYVLGRLAR